MKLRNWLGKLVGLKTGVPSPEDQDLEVGGTIGLFKIYNILEDECILGENDSHLNFRISVFNSREPEYNIKVTTLVEFNNLIGKIYFALIKPFHKAVVKALIANSLQS